MKFLVTGGAGFLGINLIRHLHSRGEQIVSLDIVGFDYPDMNNKITAIKGDIRNKSDVQQSNGGSGCGRSHCRSFASL